MAGTVYPYKCGIKYQVIPQTLPRAGEKLRAGIKYQGAVLLSAARIVTTIGSSIKLHQNPEESPARSGQGPPRDFPSRHTANHTGPTPKKRPKDNATFDAELNESRCENKHIRG